MPLGELVTVPVPLPALVTCSVNDGTTVTSNWALTVVAAVTVTTQVPVPEHPPPDQPTNVDPAAGVAVSVTEPPGKMSEQVTPQLMLPPSVTVPVPVPD